MNYLNCPACGGTILGRPYGALDGTEWCQPCYADAREQVADNYALEERGPGGLHALVLDELLDAEYRRSPGWRR